MLILPASITWLLAAIPDLPAGSTTFRDLGLAALLLGLIVLAGFRNSKRQV